MNGMYGGMETKLDTWTTGTGHGSDKHITAHAEGPGRYEREGELEDGMKTGLSGNGGERLKGKSGIVVTNSFESREGLA